MPDLSTPATGRTTGWLTGWLTDWDPEDDDAWQRQGRAVARRNLIHSVIAEHLGVSVWSLWSVLVLFMTPSSATTIHRRRSSCWW
jgi:MFS transporter, NNP family, nitrate/nitrite transporter